ncbi:MAG: polysaccharide deacetylase family protein [Myxococcales bacterium]|nr:polysaccharide deacetylase family protein [Myxococcales bacterium]
MEAIGLMYHDVVEHGVHRQSGFPTDDAATYKMSPALFDQHLGALSRSRPDGAITARELTRRITGSGGSHKRPLMITFDDGGKSSMYIAERLEQNGWRGHFFMTTGQIGDPAFLDADELRALHARGHVIGSHSHTHPLRMGALSASQLADEWGRSQDILEEILGERQPIASIPGGLYTREVARAARRAGVEILFTSEPTMRAWEVDGCLCLGRYFLKRTSPATEAGRYASGDPLLCYRQLAMWEAKKVFKKVAGPLYLRVRNAILRKS